MKKKETLIQIFFIIIIVAGLVAVPMMFSGEQRASVSLFFWSQENRNDTVLKAQNKLKDLGLYEGNLSGLFGIRTRSAIIRYQQQNNLAVNGILDIPTQNSLFAVEPVPIEIQYTLVPYTEEGNTFIEDWARYVLGKTGRRTELSGRLTVDTETAFYGEANTNLVLNLPDSESKYSIVNISSENISEFIGRDVTINGVSLPDENTQGLATVLINHINDEDVIFPITISFDEQANSSLDKWVRKVYREVAPPKGAVGVLSLSDRRFLYATGGNTTRLILTTSDGTKYVIENISTANLSSFVGKEVMLRGVLLRNTNEAGLRTIAINHIVSI